MTCTSANIIEFAIESRFLPPSLCWHWVVPILAHWRCKLANPHFLLFSSEFTKVILNFKVHIIKNRQSFSLLSPCSFPRRNALTTPMPPDLHWLMHSSVEFHKILMDLFWVGLKKPQVHRWVKISLEHSCVVVMISVGWFLCMTSPTSIMQDWTAHLWNGGPGHWGAKHTVCFFCNVNICMMPLDCNPSVPGIFT